MPQDHSDAFPAHLQRFRRTGIAATVLVFLVIVAGGVVRMSGAGMGCPDWPTCFGRIVPPTDVSQLPADYQTRYNVHGHGVATFNAAKTWTEYINRLLGALAGLATFALLLSSLPFLRRPGYRHLFVLAAATFVLIGFQGWFGARVVSSNLAPYMVTIHMFIALVIVGLLVFTLRAASRTADASQAYRTRLTPRLIAALGLVTMGQILLGTQVREAVDAANEAGLPRADWAANLGAIFPVHRSFAWAVLALSLGWLGWSFRRESLRAIRLAGFNLGLVLLALILGIVLAEAALPPWAQPAHLVVAASLLALQAHALSLAWSGQARPMPTAPSATRISPAAP